jgi:uncharacterized cofD-like protein
MKEESTAHGALDGWFVNGPDPRRPPIWPVALPRPRALGQLRVAAIGGGTGLPVVLEGLKRALFASMDGPSEAERLTAVVTVADDGGSSGRLRRAYDMLAPGDIRNCLLALADGDGPMKDLFDFRFDGRGEVAGHSLGNLILAALSRTQGDFSKAVESASEILSVRGRVLPATLANVTLVAELNDGTRVRGESTINGARRRIRRLGLHPEDAPPDARALAALRVADLIVIGPGSLYTSLIPPLLVRGVPEAIAESGARVALVMNAMTEPGESSGLNAPAHVTAIRDHAPGLPIHDVLLNTTPIADDVLVRYAAEGAVPVPWDTRSIEALGCRPVLCGLLREGPKVRHDPRSLAGALLELALGPARRLARLHEQA